GLGVGGALRPDIGFAIESGREAPPTIQKAACGQAAATSTEFLRLRLPLDLLLKEFHDRQPRRRRKFMASRMGENDGRHTDLRVVPGAAMLPRSSRTALIELQDGRNRLLLPGKLHERIRFTGDMQRRLWFETVMQARRR